MFIFYPPTDDKTRKQRPGNFVRNWNEDDGKFQLLATSIWTEEDNLKYVNMKHVCYEIKMSKAHVKFRLTYNEFQAFRCINFS